MSEIKSRADLFEAAAKMMRMCDEAGIHYAAKFDGQIESDWNYNEMPSKYEFPLAIVEGKPVFNGDKLYHNYYGCFEVGNIFIVVPENAHLFSWLPPKPKTVMVELLREDSELFANAYCDGIKGVHKSIADACKKALEQSK